MNYSKYDQELRELCAGLVEDGQREGVHAVAEANAPFAAECPACRPFFRQLALTCREKKSVLTSAVLRRAGEAEPPTPTPTPVPPAPQRNPSLRVIDMSARIFNAMAADEKNVAETWKAVQRLLVGLRDPANKTPVQAHYLDILATYIEASFEEWLNTPKPTPAGGTPAPALPGAAVDDMFS